MPYAHQIPHLTPQAAIADALYRGCLAFDSNDESLLASALSSKPSFHGPGGAHTGLAEINTLLASVGPLDTQHITSNVRVAYEDGAQTAHMTAYGRNQHCPPGKGTDPTAPKFEAGVSYDCACVLEDGVWKIEVWKMEILWTVGDRAVMGMGGGKH